MSIFTSESVTEGHPDKLADSISDVVLDALLAQEPTVRAAVETLVSTGLVVVAGEVAADDAWVDVDRLARERILEVGYDSSEASFDGNSCGVLVALHGQSADIASGVDHSTEARAGATDELDRQGAGDQGMMFGYACDETEALMPLPIHAAHRLAERLAQVRKDGYDVLYPDGKTQVSVRYDGHRVVGVPTVVLSTQHRADADLAALAQELRRRVLEPVLGELGLDTGDTDFIVNPSGRFVIGGPQGDAGLTGRKIIVDTYGGMGRHGGGAFSGKDPSKVDRSAAYAMRWAAKNVVAAGLASRCELQVAYAIGRAHPVSLSADTFDTGTVPDEQIADAVRSVFDLRPAAIIRDLDLTRPGYARVAAYGHFGRPGLTWESTDRAAALANAVRG